VQRSHRYRAYRNLGLPEKTQHLERTPTSTCRLPAEMLLTLLFARQLPWMRVVSRRTHTVVTKFQRKCLGLYSDVPGISTPFL